MHAWPRTTVLLALQAMGGAGRVRLTESEAAEVDVVRRLVESYFAISRKNLSDLVSATCHVARGVSRVRVLSATLCWVGEDPKPAGAMTYMQLMAPTAYEQVDDARDQEAGSTGAGLASLCHYKVMYLLALRYVAHLLIPQVPKAIMHFLVHYTKRGLQQHLIKSLYRCEAECVTVTPATPCPSGGYHVRHRLLAPSQPPLLVTPAARHVFGLPPQTSCRFLHS